MTHRASGDRVAKFRHLRSGRGIEPGLPPPDGLVQTLEADRYMKAVWGYLTRAQRGFLVSRSECGTDEEACEKSGVSTTTPVDWKKEAGFGGAYAVLMNDPLKFAISHLKALAPKVAGVIGEALDDGNARTRLRAAELGLRANGLMQTTVNVNERSLTYEEKLIRFRLEQGLEVPEPILDMIKE